jgi:molybdopterin converting factor subunit 1
MIFVGLTIPLRSCGFHISGYALRNPVSSYDQSVETRYTSIESAKIRVVRVQVLFFGMLKDIVGRSQESLEVVPGSSLDSIFEHYAADHPQLRELRASTVLALNQQFTKGHSLVADGDEVALLPPVSGGSGGQYSQQVSDNSGNFFALTRHPIDSKSIIKQVLRGEDGAYVDFVGVVRNNTKGRQTLFLDYECYEPMAIQVMAKLGEEISLGHPIGRIAMVHRLGRMEVGEASVAVIVTSPHRKPAFDAALEGINRLKKTVPIWKKEYFADGEVWVEGEWDDSVRQQ